MIVFPRASVLSAVLLLSACAPSPPGRGKAILGAVLIDGAGGPPLSNSIVVTAGGRVINAGRRSVIPIPSEADKIDGSGKSLLPAPIDACPAEPCPGEAPNDATLEPAHAGVFRISNSADVRSLVDRGAKSFIGIITDTEELDPAFLAQLRDLRVIFAPALVSAGAQLEIAKRNTKRLFDAGVPIAAATRGGDLIREIELLVEAGIPPLDAIVAATRNSATLLRRTDAGTVAPGKRADLLLVEGNVGEDVRNLRKVVLKFVEGEVTSR
jgi:imidazolonepropionase-like amidohydrolase